MIELVIKLQDGQPVDHPIIKENFQQCWPDLDFYNPGSGFARFQRIEPPVSGTYEILEDHGYRWNGGQVENHWIIRSMTQEEKQQKQQETKDRWQNFFPSWTFNEEICDFGPPVPYPQDGKIYRWDEPSLSWQPMI